MLLLLQGQYFYMIQINHILIDIIIQIYAFIIGIRYPFPILQIRIIKVLSPENNNIIQ